MDLLEGWLDSSFSAADGHWSSVFYKDLRDVRFVLG